MKKTAGISMIEIYICGVHLKDGKSILTVADVGFE